MVIGLLCGSLGPDSSNSAALAVTEALLAERGHRTQWIEGLASVQPFSPELADAAPAEVASFRAEVESVDALLIAAPEYAGGVSGVVKNALDWFVGSASIYHKPIAVLSVGTTGGEHAIEQLVRTLSWQGALVVATLGVGAPRTKIDEDGHLSDAATIEQLRECAERLEAALKADSTSLLSMVRSVVEPFGIDAARFGDLG